MSNGTPDKPLIQNVVRMLDIVTAEGASADTLINVLSLLCIITILNRTSSNQQSAAATPAPQTNTTSPLQKLLGDLTKGDGAGPSPDTLMSLLPLLNSPQLKSKLTPSNMTTILGLINSLGGNNSDKHESSKHDKPEKPEPKPDIKKESPAAAITDSMPKHTEELQADSETEKKPPNSSRFLNWKTSF